MMPPTIKEMDPLLRDRLVVVAEGMSDRDLLERVRRVYANWTVAACDSYLSGIADLSRHKASGVLVGVDPSTASLSDALAGLREAAGRDTRLVLICRPEGERIARGFIGGVADDYLVTPLCEDDLSRAFGQEECPLYIPASRRRVDDEPRASELAQLSELLRHLDAPGGEILRRLADLVVLAIGARGVRIVVQGTAAVSGSPVMKPVLSVPVDIVGAGDGQICVSESVEGAYSPATVRKLEHYGKVASHLLNSARAQRRWREMAYTDELSGLPNRRYLFLKLDEIIGRAAIGQLNVSVLLFDVDDFKSYNDEFGHDAGDEIIRLCGELFRKHSREQDIVSRYGGDEFVVVFWDPEGPRVPGSRHPECALTVLNRFKEALARQDIAKLGPDSAGRVTISGGIATYPWDGMTREDLLARADEALQAAKRGGKNRVMLIGESEITD